MFNSQTFYCRIFCPLGFFFVRTYFVWTYYVAPSLCLIILQIYCLITPPVLIHLVTFHFRKFVFPSLDDHPSKTLTASFQHIEEVYRLENHQCIKMAFKLNDRVINPSSIERQSFLSTQAVFHESTINALKFYGNRGNHQFLETAEFLETILNWWKTVNVKSKFLAQRKRDRFREVVTRENLTEKTSHLRSIADWLEEWEALGNRRNGLSSETFQAIKQTTEGLATLCEYLILQRNQCYVLLGKIQSDRLEGRFGKLRQMNGGNMFASVKQFLEAERSLKIKNLAKLDLSLSDIQDVFDESVEENRIRIEKAAAELLRSLETGDLIEMPTSLQDSEENILFYVAGYFSRTVKNCLKCQSCKELLVGSSNPHVTVDCENDPSLAPAENERRISFIKMANRGGLVFPSQFMFETCVLAWNLLQKICAKPDLSKLLFQPNLSSQKAFSLTFLSYLDSRVNTRKNFSRFLCKDGHEQRDSLALVSKKIFNVFSKNIVSSQNSTIHSKRTASEPDAKRINSAVKLTKLQGHSM